jgi:membrane dipeptidase
VPLLFDAHLDLSWNALSFDRDLTDSIDEINAYERCMTDSRARGHATVSLGEMRRGLVAVCVGTVLARARPDVRPAAGHQRISLDYRSPTVAGAVGLGQVAYYNFLERDGQITMLRSSDDLNRHWSRCAAEQHRLVDGSIPIGLVLAMEGADPIRTPDHAEEWYQKGLRVVNLVHYGQNQYAVGTGDSGPLTEAGIELLREFARLGIILDATHLSDPSFFQALDVFGGAVIASHQNCRALVPGDRQFSDEQLRLLVERDAVIGASFDNWMITPNWTTGVTPRSEATLEQIADHMDHICQLAGNHRHIAIGTDLDGGFGSEQSPAEIDTIADVQKLADVLERRGFAAAAIDDVFHGNWLRFFREKLPARS